MGRSLGYRNVEDITAVGADVDVAPQPHVLVLPLDPVESLFPESGQVGSVECRTYINFSILLSNKLRFVHLWESMTSAATKIKSQKPKG